MAVPHMETSLTLPGQLPASGRMRKVTHWAWRKINRKHTAEIEAKKRTYLLVALIEEHLNHFRLDHAIDEAPMLSTTKGAYYIYRKCTHMWRVTAESRTRKLKIKI